MKDQVIYCFLLFLVSPSAYAISNHFDFATSVHHGVEKLASGKLSHKIIARPEVQKLISELGKLNHPVFSSDSNSELLNVFGIFSNHIYSAKDLAISPTCAAELLSLLTSVEETGSALAGEVYCYQTKNCSVETIAHYRGILQENAWIFKVLDAFGKVPAGILLLDSLWLGSWGNNSSSNGLGSESSDSVDINALLVSLMFSQGELEYGICVPYSCTGSDINTLLTEFLSGIHFPTSTKVNCPEKELSLSGDTRAIAMIVVVSIFAMVMLLGSVFDLILHYSTAHNQFAYVDQNTLEPRNAVVDSKLSKAFLSFSLYTNTLKLFNTEKRDGQIHCIHGLRFLSMAWVILGHTYSVSMGYWANFQVFGHTITHGFLSQAIVNATVSVDSFFCMSGFLLTYLFMKEMEKSGKRLKTPYFWFMYYFHRYIRLTPPYLLFMGVEIALYRYVSTGPMWPQAEGFEQNFCRDSWWTNMLYLNNFRKLFRLDSDCFGHSWYLANDMQLYWFAPLVLLIFYNFGIFGVIECAVLIVISGSLRAWKVSQNNYPPTLLGADNLDMLEHLGNFYDDLYSKPWMRCGAYLVGMVCGYFLWKCRRNIKLPKLLVVFGWFTSSLVMLLCVFGLYNYASGSSMAIGVKAFYAATNRTVWSVGLCWIIFACATGYGGWINRFLSHSVWIPLSRLSYCAYLVHPLVVAVYYYSVQTPLTFDSHLTTVNIFAGNLLLSYVVAYAVSMAFEAPILSLEKLLLPRGIEEAKKHRPSPADDTPGKHGYSEDSGPENSVSAAQRPINADGVI